MTNVLVTGGAGYVGSVMVPQLLANGYRVTVYDILFFGREGLPDHPNLKVIEGDIRDTPRLATALEGIDVVLHLACISNDPSFELDEGLSKTINYDCFEPLVLAAKAARVKRFVYCSSSSVYGVSDKPDVTEDHPLVPLTLFNIGYQNLAIARIAEIVREVVEREFPERAPIRIETTSTNDPRSYHINSDKIKRVLGYAPRHTVEDAVRDLCRAFRDGRLPNSLDDDRYFNVRRMKAVKAV